MIGKYRIVLKKLNGEELLLVAGLSNKRAMMVIIDEALSNPDYAGCTVAVTCECKVFDVEPSAITKAAIKDVRRQIEENQGQVEYGLRLLAGGKNESV